MTIAGFTRTAFDYECAHDREFFLRASGGGNVEGLLYDLGHEGRELQDFPSRMSLTVPQPRQESVAWRPDEPNLVASMQLPQLYDQLTDEVERYIIETYRKRESGIFAPGPDVFQREIDALRALADHSKDKLVTVTFSPCGTSFTELKRWKVKAIDTKTADFSVSRHINQPAMHLSDGVSAAVVFFSSPLRRHLACRTLLRPALAAVMG